MTDEERTGEVGLIVELHATDDGLVSGKLTVTAGAQAWGGLIGACPPGEAEMVLRNMVQFIDGLGGNTPYYQAVAGESARLTDEERRAAGTMACALERLNPT